MDKSTLDLVNYSFELGQNILSSRSAQSRKNRGQFLTPPAVARFMAQQLGPLHTGERILDPAIGSGVLACAVIERAMAEGQPGEFWLDGYEIDLDLCKVSRDILKMATQKAATQGIIIHARIYEGDFVLNNLPVSQSHLFLDKVSGHLNTSAQYDHIIANPPYFKLNNHDPRVKAAAGQVKGHTNIYTLFLALAVKKLAAQGWACFIVPRSFCSGLYFASLRKELTEKTCPLAIHLFESRQDTFKNENVLQENIIYTFQRQQPSKRLALSKQLTISASPDITRLNDTPTRKILLKQFLGRRNGTLFFRLPMGELDEQILKTMDNWSGSLQRYGLNVSTGPIVAFRARNWLTDAKAVTRQQATPLLWMDNVKPQKIIWPINHSSKLQAVSLANEATPLLLPAANYVLIRRFSAKEEPRRLIAAPFLSNQYNCEWIGFENHLNYIYKKQGELKVEEAVGLSTLLNSAIIDRYFRIINGNTQVNATELRALPLPPLELIKKIGKQVLILERTENPVDFEAIVFAILHESSCLAPDIPLIRETRITMGKIQEAQEVLKALGLPPAQQNEISALTMLVLAQLSEETPWSRASRRSLRIHDILLAIKEHYGREYAENTRETIRRQVIHQFIQAALVIQNPDEPTLPTNSPRTHYALSDGALRTLRAYKTPDWEQAIQTFSESRGALLELYQKSRQQHKVHLRLATGEEYHLSPGQHNELQVAVIEEFGPRFAPGARLLYLGDTENKTLILDIAGFESLGISAPGHDKLPDIVLYDESRNWLFLIEAVTSHGPISPKRHFELEETLEGCKAERIYVTVFPDFATFKNFITNIAWETEVWLAEIPDHLIHFNGDRFLGPHS